ncbi:hypothetical protein BDK51DRAFT_43317 [Blyttiomyces helicus]|uniref:Uncharacterized protein n=1 Tax=Blyttiomyces helicus TaxID=388810 RepID=A0A4P9VXP9_9FUNG|nr:hypothetical protein BDK51DRAFT_43317 [Blyttiomyces helicus]|eukprot:RKO84514.1 hypothetical protein BDK51DRAFT_43317 [Blyttiomyces helicus]
MEREHPVSLVAPAFPSVAPSNKLCSLASLAPDTERVLRQVSKTDDCAPCAVLWGTFAVSCPSRKHTSLSRKRLTPQGGPFSEHPKGSLTVTFGDEEADPEPSKAAGQRDHITTSSESLGVWKRTLLHGPCGWRSPGSLFVEPPNRNHRPTVDIHPESRPSTFELAASFSDGCLKITQCLPKFDKRTGRTFSLEDDGSSKEEIANPPIKMTLLASFAEVRALSGFKIFTGAFLRDVGQYESRPAPLTAKALVRTF